MSTNASTLRHPEISSGETTLIFMATSIADGEYDGARYEVDGIGFTFSATVIREGRPTLREILDIKPIIGDWVEALVQRSKEES